MKSILIDSQLLLLLVVGLGSRTDIRESKRLSMYSETDFDRLVQFVSKFDTIVTLPNILTEVSNFIGDSDMPRSVRARAALKALIENVVEVYQPSHLIVNQDEFEWLGITDVAQLLLLEDGHALITNDGRLFGAALKRGLQAITFAQMP